jgi:hypothetical protein
VFAGSLVTSDKGTEFGMLGGLSIDNVASWMLGIVYVAAISVSPSILTTLLLG